MLILGMETSCDDTSVCLAEKLSDGKTKILQLQTLSMYESLQPFGGIVPEIVSRNHVRKITHLIQACLENEKKALKDIDYLAVTTMPGLLGALLTGINAAKTLSLLHQLPVIAVNHLHAHVTAVHITENVQFPYLSLLVSGGHTILFWCEGPNQFEILGSTNDDAAGEAFDKGGKLLGLSYPAGPLIDKLAKTGNENTYDFPVGLKNQDNCNFSFSGVKTALRYKIERTNDLRQLVDDNKANYKKDKSFFPQSELLSDICASYQKAIVTALSLKTHKALKKIIQSKGLNAKNIPIVVGGGVACNSKLRKNFIDKFGESNTFFVQPKYCTDNAAMITHHAGLNLELAKRFPHSLSMEPSSRFLNKKDYR
ncbi:tRNA (adenosine(37)-N6)-threonylcarbamoyltransferase complex transferase subunit TsaD [Bacteriovoracaceae bacterium]|nr:tRNA (adenosine(37)-N6)-threonylcarbamoyltransferase complex transferase subunit TsaD [Bacteriovoracaceae bacterium]